MQKLFLLVFLIATWANATVRYVNNSDGTCGGHSPCYTHIQNAVSAAVAGDDIRIQTTGTPYNESVSTASAGTSGSPITIESDNHASPPVWYYAGSGSTTGALVVNHAFWTAQYLLFDGTGIYTSRLGVWPTGSVTNFIFQNNTMRNWGGTQAQRGTAVDVTGFNGGGSFQLIQNNVFDGVAGTAIGYNGMHDTVITNNEIKNESCAYQPGWYPHEEGIKAIDANDNGTSSYNDTISHNTFHDFQPQSSCTLGSMQSLAGLHCDVGAVNSVVDSNLWYNIPDIGGAIWIEADCHGWTVKNNVIYNVVTGIHDNNSGNPPSTGPNNLYYNNTIYNFSFSGIDIASGYATVENNVVYGSSVANMDIWSENLLSRGNQTIDYNIYYAPAGQVSVGDWGGVGNVDFATWKADCACDSHSINANPLFAGAPSNLQLMSTSPAKDKGLTIAAVPIDYLGVTRPQGAGYDMGAYEFPAVAPLAPPTNLTATPF